MERFKRFTLVASSLMLVLALVTVLGSKEVHAVVASMVQVVNNASNPVPNKDVDNPARHAFQASCIASAASNEASCTVTTVPAGQELVIQEVTVLVSTDPGVAVQASINTGAAGDQHVAVQDAGVCENICLGSPTVHIYTGATPLTTYADPGAPVYITVLRNAAPPADGIFLSGTVSGYFVRVP